MAQAAEAVSRLRLIGGDDEVDLVVDLVVVTTLRVASRRPDGATVVPLALLGP